MQYPASVTLTGIGERLTLPLFVVLLVLFALMMSGIYLLRYIDKLKGLCKRWKNKHQEAIHEKDFKIVLEGLKHLALNQEEVKIPLVTVDLEPLRHYCMKENWESIQALCNHSILAPVGWKYAADYALKREAFLDAYENLLRLNFDVRYVRLRLADQGVKLSPLTLSSTQLALEMFLRKEEDLREAFKGAPHFLPIALKMGDEKTLLEAYKKNPHRDLAAAWKEKDALKRFKTLEAITPKEHPEGSYVLSCEAKVAGLTGEAEHYAKLATVQGEWMCTACHHVSLTQWPWCSGCHAVDSFVWK